MSPLRNEHEILDHFLLLFSQLAHAGSWTSGGGGTGIACFDSEAAAQSIRDGASFAQSPELIQSLTSVSMTDYAENASDTFVETLSGESPRLTLSA